MNLRVGQHIGLYNMFVHFNAFVNEPSLIVLPPPTCNARTVAIVLHDYCARYAPSPTPLLYAIHHTRLVIAILCIGQTTSRVECAYESSSSIDADVFLG